MLYTIGEMAKELGINASTLRYYDKEGLLPFVERSNGGIRMFTDKDYAALKLIGCLKRSGLSIKEIKAYIKMAAEGDSSLEERQKLFENRRKAVKQQMEELAETLEVLNYKCWYYEAAVSAGSEKAVKRLSKDELPQQFRKAKAKLEITEKEESESLPAR